MTTKLKRTLIAATTVAALAAGGAAVAGATGVGGDDDATDRPITGSALDRAKAAALADTPGKVTETEVGDEEGAYEVEVTRPDGSQVDVHLDRNFNVLGAQADDGGADDQDESGDD
jgi:uncharacterized membrane protein YkoI